MVLIADRKAQWKMRLPLEPAPLSPHPTHLSLEIPVCYDGVLVRKQDPEPSRSEHLLRMAMVLISRLVVHGPMFPIATKRRRSPSWIKRRYCKRLISLAFQNGSIAERKMNFIS